MRSEITTVGELVNALAVYPLDIRVRLAVAPGWFWAVTFRAVSREGADQRP